MLTINLLPENLRRVGPSPLEQLHRTPLVFITVSLMAAIPLLLIIPATMRQQQAHQLQAKMDTLKPKKAQLDEIQTILRTLRAQETAFRDLGNGQQLWSRRLNVLSNLTPDGIWFTELSLDQGKELVIQGSAIGREGTETGSVSRLAQALKEHADFSSGVKDIQIESIKRGQDKEIELVQFTLNCPLLEVTTP